MDEVKQKLILDYNSAYISINLIDELDFVIGGYGKANVEFLYSLNTFVESFVLNEKFYLSDKELRHLQLTSSILFPNGRPILDLLAKTHSLAAISGLGTQIAKIVYIGSLISQESNEIEKAIGSFQSSFVERMKNEYFITTDISKSNYELKYLGLSVQGNMLIVVESVNESNDIVKSLFDATDNTNIQTTMPLYMFKSQLREIKKYGISNEIFHKLVDIHNKKSEDLKKYFGFNYQLIPPLVPILLSQCKSIDNIPDKLMQLREDFKNLRETIISFEKQINESKTIKEQLKAIDDFNKFWEIFHKKYDIPTNRLVYNFWDIAKNSEFDKSVDNSIDSESASEMIKDLNLGKVAGKIASKTYSWIKEKRILSRFKGITNAWELFNNKPTLKQQYKDIERIFSLTIDEGSLNRIKQFVDKIEQDRS